jgi:FKBP-type peptidyl-prolyl cis-trans isomerase
MKKVFNLLLVVVTLSGLLVSSSQSGDGFKETETGLRYKYHYKGDDTTSPKAGQFIDIDLILKTNDTVFFDTRTIPADQRSPIPMGTPMFEGDVFEGIAMMHVGDSCTFAVAADSVWKLMFRTGTPPAGQENAEYVFYEIKLNEVIDREEMNRRMEVRRANLLAEEEAERNGFLTENYPEAVATESGLYYVRTKRGSGSTPEKGQMVKVNYTGKLLDGTQFDSSEGRDPIEFALGTGRVIKGWDEGIAMMRKGEKAVLIIPSTLGYGERGSQRIPPFSTLVFDVELVDFKDAE